MSVKYPKYTSIAQIGTMLRIKPMHCLLQVYKPPIISTIRRDSHPTSPQYLSGGQCYVQSPHLSWLSVINHWCVTMVTDNIHFYVLKHCWRPGPGYLACQDTLSWLDPAWEEIPSSIQSREDMILYGNK